MVSGEGSGDGGIGNDDGGSTDDEGNIAEDDEVNGVMNNLELVGVFKAWLRLQVDRSQAVRKLTAFCARSPAGIKLNLLAVKYLVPKPAVQVMEPWRITLADLYPASSTTHVASDIINILQGVIDQELEFNRAGCHSIFHKFDPNGDDIEYKGNDHCEMILGCLLKFPTIWAGNEDLTKCLQVWSRFQYHVFVNLTCCIECGY